MASQAVGGGIVFTKSRTTKKKKAIQASGDGVNVGLHTTKRRKTQKREALKQFSLSAADEEDNEVYTGAITVAQPQPASPPPPNHGNSPPVPDKEGKDRSTTEPSSDRRSLDSVSGTLRNLLKDASTSKNSSVSVSTVSGATILTGSGTTQGLGDWTSSQRVEDFMDERDAEEWGGPVKVRKDYGDAASNLPQRSRRSNDEVTEPSAALAMDLPLLPQDSLGYRLLKHLGWRDRTTGLGNGQTDVSTAYVPIDDQQSTFPGHVDKVEESDGPPPAAASIVLSRKRLRKIALRQRAIAVPPPKIDAYGIGYQPFADAPEFQEHRERRQLQARERARRAEAAMLSGGNIQDEKFIGSTQNVYRASDLLGDDDRATDQIPRQSAGSARSDEQDVMAFETAEDFVGTKSVGGFALRDDDDDNVYDATGSGRSAHTFAASAATKGLVRIGNEEFHHELQEYHSDSDDETFRTGTSSVLDVNHHRQNNPLVVRKKKRNVEATVDDFAGALDAWATSSSDPPSVGVGGATAHFLKSHDNSTLQKKDNRSSERRPAVAGFVLGISGGGTGARSSTRWEGPVVPKRYELKPHEFHEEELPSRVRKKSALLRWKAEQEHRRRRALENKEGKDTKKRETPPMRQPKEPLTGAKFSALKAAMESRFTKGSLESDNSNANTVKNAKSSAHVVNDGERNSGLERPRSVMQPAEASTPNRKVPSQQLKQVKAVRAIIPWMPSNRLCQIMGIAQPAPQKIANSTVAPSGGGTMEQSFFEKEILAFARQKIAAAESVKPLKNESNSLDDLPPDYVEKSQLPPKEVLSSIFEASSDEESRDDDEDDLEHRSSGTSAAPVVHPKNDPAEDGAKDVNINNIAKPVIDTKRSSDKGGDHAAPSRDVEKNLPGDSAESGRSRRPKADEGSATAVVSGNKPTKPGIDETGSRAHTSWPRQRKTSQQDDDDESTHADHQHRKRKKRRRDERHRQHRNRER